MKERNMPADVRSERIEFRLPAENKLYIERAAALQGRTVSDFAKNVLLEQAKSVIAEYETVRLSDRDRVAFLRLLDDDAALNENLKRAAKRYREKIA